MSNRGQFTTDQQPANRGGRKRGTPNKVTTALKEAILEAAEQAGGPEGMVGYLKKLAVINSSAFAGLLGKVLPSTIQGSGEQGEHQVNVVAWQVHDSKLSDWENGGYRQLHIAWPDGRKEIEGVTPKQVPAPAPASAEVSEPGGRTGKKETAA